MSENIPAPPGKSRVPFVIAGVLLVLAGIVLWRAHAAKAAREAEAQATFGPAVQAVAKAAEAAPEPVDLDRTVRALQAVDLALQDQHDGRAWLRELAMQDHRGVPKDVLAARAELLRVLQRLYATQEEAADQAAFWDFSSRTVLSVLSLVEVGPTGVKTDRAQAEKLLQDARSAEGEHARLVREIGRLEGELLPALQRYAEASWPVLEEWDRLTALRDRAYLATRERDWATVVDSADKAIALSPNEREAHLLKALALIETTTGVVEGGHAEEAGKLLREFIAAHPDGSAPALVLAGVLAAKTGDAAGAKLDFEQAAVNFPRQAAALSDRLDAYKVRAYLRKSADGKAIIEAYQQTMLGAGYFSPDLQLARQFYLAGDTEAGNARVMDHFSRRRAQREWAALAADVSFCSTFLGAHFRRIFPEESYLDLVATPSLLGSSLGLKVRNRSAQTLHNATLVVAIHFTDMQRDDEETFTPERTQPALLANDTTDFGDLPVKLQLFGREKTVKDIVSVRAILVADEAVTSVDTEPFKLAEDAALKGGKPMPAPEKAEFLRVAGLPVETLEARLKSGVALALDSGVFKDDVVLTLPRELAILKPSFRLRYGGQELVATENEIRDGAIRLKFRGVANFASTSTKRERMELVIGSRVVGLTIAFAPNATGYAIEGVKVE